ncbi:glycosyltransferase [Porifericola rhodea]|uniref:glycosyltransferase n=1 Tax=Porifericola rhodea TaxID=930972 RepID=UPI0026664A6F|nr:glycosyltransferase [Porifericola rhodea]WKN29786.1 glycosyltransferase [Porifericola rhodea]
MSKKTIVHVIDSLGIGGAETLLVHANVQIPSFRHIVVYLRPPFAYKDSLNHIPTYCLAFQGWRSLPQCIKKLKAIVHQHQAAIVHSHLYYSTIVVRLAFRRKITVINSYHNVLYDPRGSNYSKVYRWLDRVTYRNTFNTVSVSSTVKSDLEKYIGIKQQSRVIYNYVEDRYFQVRANVKDKHTSPCRIVSVGNLKPQKNYPWALQVLAPLFKENTQLSWDIYGDGPERETLVRLIDKNQLSNVHLKGKASHISELISQYHLFFMPSQWEGFGIALVEAMAARIPCLVSDLPVFKEVAGASVYYFALNDKASLLTKMVSVMDHVEEWSDKAEMASQRAQNFTKSHYNKQLLALYES